MASCSLTKRQKRETLLDTVTAEIHHDFQQKMSIVKAFLPLVTLQELIWQYVYPLNDEILSDLTQLTDIHLLTNPSDHIGRFNTEQYDDDVDDEDHWQIYDTQLERDLHRHRHNQWSQIDVIERFQKKALAYHSALLVKYTTKNTAVWDALDRVWSKLTVQHYLNSIHHLLEHTKKCTETCGFDVATTAEGWIKVNLLRIEYVCDSQTLVLHIHIDVY